METLKAISELPTKTAIGTMLGRWSWPMFFSIIVFASGVLSYRAVQRLTRINVESKLTAILETDIKALTIWTNQQKRDATYFAGREDVRRVTSRLLNARLAPAEFPSDIGLQSRNELQSLFRQACDNFGYVRFRMLDRDGRILIDQNEALIGHRVGQPWDKLLEKLFEGESILAPPTDDYFSKFEARPIESTTRPWMLVAAAVRDESDRIVAAVAFGIPPESEFTDILSVARAGESGETYAFDANGRRLSERRFEGNSAERRPTKIMASALLACQREDTSIGLNLDGYEDYRGTNAVAAYRWLPEYDFGIVTKMDYREAYAPGLMLRKIFGGLFGVALLAIATNVVNTRRLLRYQSRIAQAERRVKRLGQYTLQEKIGEGGMGEVYRATHAMLRRPTAVKLLRPERSSEAAVERFEHEVQMTALLTHPNTIAIYDYGRTSEGTFYYAMEYLDGLDLSRIVRIDGPQPAGRVIEILRQVCNSLNEAHESGLVHRDIKPANVILFRRGGRADIVKVLDFGLVRNVECPEQSVRDTAVAGTPAYMSPESFRTPHHVGPESDLYAVGALGYFLLTGTNPFEGNDLVTMSHRHKEQLPDPPSQRLGRQTDRELSRLLMQCLEKKPEDRPRSAAELSRALSRCLAASTWTRDDAIGWWERLDRPSAGASAVGHSAPDPREHTTHPAEKVTFVR